MKLQRRVAALLVISAAVAACQSASSTELKGAGATFPAPVYRKWIGGFLRKSPGMPISYEATGSGEGLRLLKAGKIDFAASDIPLSPAEQRQRNVRLLPAVVGAVVPAYNIPGLQKDLRFTPELLAGIFSGQITQWDDRRLHALNHDAHLSAMPIAVVHRSDESGTTFAFSEFLSKSVPAWQNMFGTASLLRWPVGEGIQGNDAMTAAIAQKPGSIGYVEFIYAVQQHLGFGAVRNASGRFVRADIDSLTAAAESAVQTSGALDISLANAPGAGSYPISSFTWLVVPNQWMDPVKRSRMAVFLDWALSSGQREAAALGYVAVPDAILAREQTVLGEWKEGR